ncbi:homeobox-leucine zipper protein HAT22-like [Rhodamnia argentea]|uniref:Homeobox-leucine zipper protein HAT22-like n=1 Tax=Rhodamnia argentea TaxID=178133 RepID=A0A8B8P1J0_9MYRT|nr:homeobox-leucine zipper protein HAT22-like [Rhodamnia argentea]
MDSDRPFDTSLNLGLGFYGDPGDHEIKIKKPLVKLSDNWVACLTIGLPGAEVRGPGFSSGEEAGTTVASGPASSFSNSSSVKREKMEQGEEDAVDIVVISPRATPDVEDDDEFSPRKKLRLSKAQSSILEESFKVHTTLNTKQKHDLANQLNLRPRQVEVWFQNRRARTKLKQTEVECEMLKKCCETLKEENRRLRKELQELKSMKPAASVYRQIPAAALPLCPSCERIGHPDFPFSNESRLWPNRPAHPSAAC